MFLLRYIVGVCGYMKEWRDFFSYVSQKCGSIHTLELIAEFWLIGIPYFCVFPLVYWVAFTGLHIHPLTMYKDNS
jgi:hypothetical protein